MKKAIKNIFSLFVNNAKSPVSIISGTKKNILYQRLQVVIIFIIGAFLLISIKLVKVSLTNKESSEYSIKPSTFSRNEIIDRNGTLLAVDLAIVSLYATPKSLLDPIYTAEQLIKIFPEFGLIRPSNRFEKVVFPDPLLPTNP